MRDLIFISRFFIANDRASLHLVLLFGILALLGIFILRWYSKPKGAVYRLVGSLPFAGGTIWGMHQCDQTIHRFLGGGLGPESPLDDLTLAFVTVHFGLFTSALLYLVILYFYARDYLSR